MNSQERMLATLSHREPDRIPFDMGTTKVTGITASAYRRLTKHLGMDVGEVEWFDTIQQMPVMNKVVLEWLQVDTRGLMPNVGRKNPTTEMRGQDRVFYDEWGMMWHMPPGVGYYSVGSSPLSGDITVEDVEAHAWPDGGDPALIHGLQEKAQAWHEAGYAIVLESICAGLFEMGCRLRGFEQFYMDLASNPELAGALLDRILEIKLQFYEMVARELGEFVLVIREGDDVGGQESLLMSPRMYRRHLKPRHKMLFEAQRRLFPQPFRIFFHSDGAISELLPDLIEIGVEVLNPVQASAAGMEAAKLKREFGRDLVFWGGAISPHDLAEGTPAQVRIEVTKRIEALAPGGGYIFGTVHNVQDDVPIGNLMALWETFMEQRGRSSDDVAPDVVYRSSQ